MYKSIKLHLFFLQIWSSLIRLLQGVVRRRPSQFITVIYRAEQHYVRGFKIGSDYV